MCREYIFMIDGTLYNEETGEAVMKPEFKGELIRCKDCNKNYGSEHNPRCDYMDAYLWPDSFCSYAERKEGEADG